MTSLYVHPRLGEVTLSQTVRARRISISVRATGAVRLSFPCGVPQKRALDFLEQKAEWIGGQQVGECCLSVLPAVRFVGAWQQWPVAAERRQAARIWV